MGVQSIGMPVRREEDFRLLRGKGRYVDDVRLPREARGYVVRSPHAHARIVALDAVAARAAPGVLAVLTGDNVVSLAGGISITVSDGETRHIGAGEIVLVEDISGDGSLGMFRSEGRLGVRPAHGIFTLPARHGELSGPNCVRLSPLRSRPAKICTRFMSSSR
jgi:Aldehyde oxidase and xanthine dehydrogenase, a/b hammerhead domain